MNQQNRQPDLHDEQAVIAAVQLLVRSMKPAQKEKLLLTLWHEQGENVLPDDSRPEQSIYEHGDDAGSEAGTYPIQPLVLASDDSQRASSESNAQTLPENSTDSPREFHYEEGTFERQREERRPLETYTAFFLPFTSSLSRRQWWTRLALGTIFLFLLSLSTLVVYQAGVRAGAMEAAQASAAACQGRTYIVVEGRPLFFFHREQVVTDGNGAILQQQDAEGHVYYIVGSSSGPYWEHASGMLMVGNVDSQCTTSPPIKIFLHHHDNDDD